MTSQANPENPRAWQLKSGWTAFAICVLGTEGLIFGASRSCMPSFDLGILLGQLLLLNVLGSPILLGALCGSAFVVAASPRPISLRQKWPRLIFLAVCLVAVMAIGFRFAAGTLAVAIGFLGSGVLVGFLVRKIGWLRRFWLPIGIVIALALGSLLWTFGHYGQDNCWP